MTVVAEKKVASFDILNRSFRFRTYFKHLHKAAMAASTSRRNGKPQIEQYSSSESQSEAESDYLDNPASRKRRRTSPSAPDSQDDSSDPDEGNGGGKLEQD